MSDSPTSPDAIFSEAKARGKQMDLPYAGALMPPQAHALADNAAAMLIDVRTAAELAYVGRVHTAAAIEWQSYPTMEVNIRFVEELREIAPAGMPLLFLCRSGARSHYAAAAAAAAGYEAYNVLEGFEGDLDGEGHRNNVNGWRARQLPWVQT